jgi:hypothetical protein
VGVDSIQGEFVAVEGGGPGARAAKIGRAH